MDVTEVMDSLRAEALKSIAKNAGISKSITRKTELIEALNRFVTTDPATFLDRLGPSERNFLAEAVHNGNRVSPVVFSAKYKVDCPRPRREGSRSLIQLVIAQERGSPEIEIPETIGDLLRPLLEKPAAPRPAIVERIPETFKLHDDDVRPIHVYSGERTALVELRRVLQLVQGGKVRIQPKSGRPTPATERAIAASLATPDLDLELPKEQRNQHSLDCGHVRAHAWAVAIQQCGWSKASGETLKLTKDGQRLLGNPSPEAFREGIEALSFDDKFDELHRINNIRGQSGKARRWMTEPSERRGEIIEGLAEWPVNEWLSFDEAYRFVNACGHVFLVIEDSMYLYFSEHRYGYITDADGIDRQYMRAVLMETLATLGLVDLAYVYPHHIWPDLGGVWGTDFMDFCGRYDGLLYIRLNALGSYCLGASEHYAPPAAEKRNLFTVLPNREIAVAGGHPLLPGDISMLELLAEKKGDRLWRIEPPLILDYLENGGSLDDLSGFLTENAAEEIPETIRVLFEDLKAKSSAASKAEEAWLVEFQDPAVAALIAHDSKAGKLCLLAGKRHLAVAKNNERSFRTAMKNLGFVLPR